MMVVADEVVAESEDAAARQAIRYELGRTLFVEAGAGTGKTTALVGRIVELVVTGEAEIGQIVAITFTEAAAGELRDRIAEELERVAGRSVTDWVGATPGDDVARDQDLMRERGERALVGLPDAVIGTLHGFARRILTEHPFEAAVPPGIEVSDDVRATVDFEERWEAMLGAILGDPSLEGPLQRLLCCGARLDDLRAMAAVLNENWDLAEPAAWAAAPAGMQGTHGLDQPEIDATAIAEALTEAVGLARWCTDAEDKLVEHLLGLQPLFEGLARYAAEPLVVLELLARSPALGCRRSGQKRHWSGRIEEVRDALDDAETRRQDLLRGVGSAALWPVLSRVAALTVDAAERRRLEGRLEFHDLLVLSRRLLRDRPDVCEALSRRWTRIFVDELQDTDPIQIELAVRIAAGGVGDRTVPTLPSWQELDVAPGRLFFVGDPKQSIYRFRRADIAQFMTAREHFGGPSLLLTRNHRSVPGIVSWVNAAFGALMGDGIPGEQPAYVPLLSDRPACSSTGVPVVVLGGAQSGDLDQVRREEAIAIAEAVCRVRDEQWVVTSSDGEAPARLSDIAVLVPTRLTLPIIQEAFDEREIPYRLEGTSVVYRSPEVRDLVAVLRAVDDPTDEVAVVAALRTPLLGCGDDDLARFVAGGGRWDYRRVGRGESTAEDGDGDGRAEESADPVTAGLRRLRSFHEARWWCEPSELVERVLIDCRALELALDRPRPRESWRCLRFVADQARQYADAFAGDLRRYIRWVDHQQRDDVRATEAVLPERDHDAVRIMTVHAAKGLEFPVVLLAGLNANRGSGRVAPLLFGAGGPEAALTDVVRTPGFDALEDHERQMDESEQIRLLYVAATRARDYLIVSLHHQERRRDCHAARLEEVCGRRPELWRRLPAKPVEPEQQQFVMDGVSMDTDALVDVDGSRDGDDEAFVAARREWIITREALLTTAGEPRTLSATGLAKLAGSVETASAVDLTGGDGEPDDGGAHERPAWRRGRAGTGVGRAVHAVLQSVDLRTAEGIEMLAEKEAWAEGVPGRTVDVIGLVRAALGSEPVREAVGCGRYWRELYVGAPFGDRVLEGFVDLLVDGPSGLTVVDYKTDRFSEPLGAESAMDSAMARYRLQGAAYALALSETLGRAVERCAFVFLRPDGATTRFVDDLQSATHEARQLLVAGRTT